MEALPEGVVYERRMHPLVELTDQHFYPMYRVNFRDSRS